MEYAYFRNNNIDYNVNDYDLAESVEYEAFY